MDVQDVMRKDVTDLELSVRTTNILIAEGLNTIGDIIRAGKVRIATFPHFGRRQMQELEEVLTAYKIDLPTGLVKQYPVSFENVDYIVTTIDEGFRYEVSAFGKTPRVVRAASPQLAIQEFNTPPNEKALRQCERDGFEVAYSGKMDSRNPFRVGTEFNKHWQIGYDRGVDKKGAELATVEVEIPPIKELPERVAVEISREELKILHDYWLDKARVFEVAGNKEEAERAFERSCRMGDLRHSVK